MNDVEKELKSIRNDVVIEQKVIDFSTFEDYSGLRQVFTQYIFFEKTFFECKIEQFMAK